LPEYFERSNLAWMAMFLDSPGPSGPIFARPQRLRRAHEGWNQFNTPGIYFQRWQIDVGMRLARPVQKPIKSPVLFLVNNTSYPHLRGFLGTLQAQGRAAVVWEQTGRFETSKADPDDAPEPSYLVSFPGGVDVAL